VSSILFVMLHPGFIRYYEDALDELAAAGHHVHLAFEISRTKLGEDVTAQRLATRSPRITCGTTPERTESVRQFLVRGDRTAVRGGEGRPPIGSRQWRQEAWESLATTVRLLLDYLRFFEPAFAGTEQLRARAEKRLPRLYVPLVRIAVAAGRPGRRLVSTMLRLIEQMIPAPPAIDEFLQQQRPDVVLVTPLIELGSQQVDYVKSARRLGIRSALCVASWDNLTSKGLIRVVPDHVVVWNDAQKGEAVALHGVAPARVVVTGAQLFDRWFDARPSRSREAFCQMVGLDPARPFVLYVGSSMFIAPDEVPFAERWIARLRGSAEPTTASVGVLVRPHPANARQWRAFDGTGFDHVAIWPPIGTDPNAPDFRRDYFDSLYYSVAVVGINTSAQLEAGIVGRPVFTIRAPEFAHSQEGTLHFRYLIGAHGLVRTADAVEAHTEQLSALLSGREDASSHADFVRDFIRPHGLDVPVSPLFAKAIDDIVRAPAPFPERTGTATVALRPFAFLLAVVARSLADDRPLWTYLLRPLVAAAVWVAAVGYWLRGGWHALTHTGVKRMRRATWRAWYESTRALGKWLQRLTRPLRRGARQAGSAAKRVVRRQL